MRCAPSAAVRSSACCDSGPPPEVAVVLLLLDEGLDCWSGVGFCGVAGRRKEGERTACRGMARPLPRVPSGAALAQNESIRNCTPASLSPCRRPRRLLPRARPGRPWWCAGARQRTRRKEKWRPLPSQCPARRAVAPLEGAVGAAGPAARARTVGAAAGHPGAPSGPRRGATRRLQLARASGVGGRVFLRFVRGRRFPVQGSRSMLLRRWTR